MLVCIDAGHGMNSKGAGYDPGAVNRLMLAEEAEIALEWALTLKHVLTANGVPCVLTRTSAHDPCPLASRALIARKYHATHFVSIHCNSSVNPLASGTETFYREGPAKWAEDVHLAALKALGLKDRGMKHESKSPRKRLAVLAAPDPCLLELGFISCPKDLVRLKDRDRRIAFADALLDLIKP